MDYTGRWWRNRSDSDADAKAALLAREAGELGRIYGAIPADAMAIFQRFIIEELPEDIVLKITQLAGKQTPVTGMPISTKVEWSAKAEACGVAEKAAAEQQEEQLSTSSPKGLLSSWRAPSPRDNSNPLQARN